MSGNLAIIPVRTGSKRLPGKNVRDFHGAPLFTYSIKCAFESELFDCVHVSTESKDVSTIAESYGTDQAFLRPESLATDTATLKEVCTHVLDEYEQRGQYFSTFCILWATAPLRRSLDLQNAYEMLDEETEAVVAVTEYELPVYCAQYLDNSGALEPLFPDKLRLPSSEIPRIVCDNGSFCWVQTRAFREHDTWLPPKLKGYEMPRHRSADIDVDIDWEWASFLFAQEQGKK